ncbi:MAG: LpxD N-terminal domain-containing protein, partial [Hyphomonadaceae bacterium]
MIDPRFYESLGAVSARALAAGLDVGGDADRLVLGVAAAEEAGPQDLCYLERPNAVLTRAPGACILPVGQARFAPKAAALIFSDHPRATFARLAPRLARPRSHEGMALIHVSARLETDVRLAPGVVIGPDAEIGAGVEIGANSVIGPGVAIGRRTRIGAGVLIQCALIGDDVHILAGAVIGEQGFGVAVEGGALADMPHLGRVIVQDR